MLKWIIGGIVAVGGVIWYLSKNKKPQTFSEFCDECIEDASSDIRNQTNDNIAKIVVVLTCPNGKDVEPYSYRRYIDGTVRKKKIGIDTFPLVLCSNEAKDAIAKGEYIIKTFNIK